jgi:hypothetical protein
MPTLEYENTRRVSLEESDDFVRLTYPASPQRTQIFVIVVLAFGTAANLFNLAATVHKALRSAARTGQPVELNWWLLAYFGAITLFTLTICISLAVRHARRSHIGDSLLAERETLIWTHGFMWGARHREFAASEIAAITVEPVRIPAMGRGFKLEFLFKSGTTFAPPPLIVAPELPLRAASAFRHVLDIPQPPTAINATAASPAPAAQSSETPTA